jgi:hypothetical protein
MEVMTAQNFKRIAIASSISAGYLLLATPVLAQYTPPPYAAKGDLTNLPKLIINYMFPLAGFLAVIYLMYGGIRYIMSRGDKMGVESARKHILAAIVGLLVVIGSFVIVNTIFNVAGSKNPLTSDCKPTLENPDCN